MQAVLNKIAKNITVSYSDVFPNPFDDYFHFVYLEKAFLVGDTYCMNPNCSCQEVVLNFVQAYPRESAKSDSFMIRMKLNGRGYKIHEHGKFTRREIQAIVMHFTVNDENLKTFNQRFKKMKEKAIEILLKKELQEQV